MCVRFEGGALIRLGASRARTENFAKPKKTNSIDLKPRRIAPVINQAHCPCIDSAQDAQGARFLYACARSAESLLQRPCAQTESCAAQLFPQKLPRAFGANAAARGAVPRAPRTSGRREKLKVYLRKLRRFRSRRCQYVFLSAHSQFKFFFLLAESMAARTQKGLVFLRAMLFSRRSSSSPGAPLRLRAAAHSTQRICAKAMQDAASELLRRWAWGPKGSARRSPYPRGAGASSCALRIQLTEFCQQHASLLGSAIAAPANTILEKQLSDTPATQHARRR